MHFLARFSLSFLPAKLCSIQGKLTLARHKLDLVLEDENLSEVAKGHLKEVEAQGFRAGVP